MHPFFVCASSEGSDETAQMRSLVRAFAACILDKHPNLVSGLICPLYKLVPSDKIICRLRTDWFLHYQNCLFSLGNLDKWFWTMNILLTILKFE